MLSSETIHANCRPTYAKRQKTSNDIGCSWTYVKDANVWGRVWSSDEEPRTSWTLGLPLTTGTIQFERVIYQGANYKARSKRTITTEAAAYSLSTIRASIALPKWLSHKVLEIIALSAQIGWKQYLRVRNIFPEFESTIYTIFALALGMTQQGHLDGLKSLFASRKLTPWDEDIGGMTFMIAMPSWTMTFTTEERDVLKNEKTGIKIESRWKTRAEMINESQKLIGRLGEDDDNLKISLLRSNKAPLDEFLGARRSAWPDSRFYDPDFVAERMHFAIAVACCCGDGRLAPAKIRSNLGLDNGSAQHRLDFSVLGGGQTLFQGLAMKIGVNHDEENASEWHTLTMDILTHVTDIWDLHECGHKKTSKGLRRGETPLMSLIQFAHTRGGIDLLQYGRNEKKIFRELSYLDEEPMFLFWSNPHVETRFRTGYRTHLINFQYGRFPTDWKFWWCEPSDEFSGDFWSLVEPQHDEAIMDVLGVPGAWVD
ncbi:hypothetical protein Daus18300_013643 [Diaporthe australafricana]|uniref:Uncharacterized protein n=1 Tax=Diaporthe australafricana TaxID=127596 RepID=A0ABR3VY80_9PEZI